MATEFISNSWLMPENSNQDKLANYSLSFDGSTQYIDLTEQNYSGAFSMSFWVNPIEFTSNNRAFLVSDDTNQNFIWLLANNDIRLKINGNQHIFTESGGNDIVPSTWQNIIITRDGSNNVNCFRNSSAFGSSGSISGTFDINKIARAFSGSWMYEGKITELSIFDYALSASQVTQLYGTGSAVGNPMSLSTKPVAYYPLGQSAFNGEFLATNKATELYENYSLQLDGSDDFINCGNAFTQTGAFSVSAWIKTSTTSATSVLYKNGVFQFGKDSWYNGGVANAPNLSLTDSGGITKLFRNGVAPSGATVTVGTVVDLKDGNWHHIAFTYNGTNQGKYYTDGVVSYTYDITDGSWAGTLASNSNDLLIGKTTVANWNGNVSNISIYSSELTSAQVTTLYNNGKPFDLSTFAVTPVSWWRLGSVNSSYNSTSSEWTILDEIGTNNGTGSNLGPAQSALVDGVGATGNGVSSGMSSGTNKVGNSPYSDNNAVSYNMSVTAKSTSVPT